MIEANEINSTFYALRILSHGLDTSEIEAIDGEEYPASEFTREEQEQALKLIHSIQDSELGFSEKLLPDKIDFYVEKLADRIEELSNDDLAEAGYAVETLSLRARKLIQKSLKETVALTSSLETDQPPESSSLQIRLAHLLARRLSEIRKSGELPYLRPDRKSQVTVEYRDGRPFRASAIVISEQDTDDVLSEKVSAEIEERIIRNVVLSEPIDYDTKVHINLTDRFVTGGPEGDAGLTGRKIIVDAYGGYAPHGGGASLGKEPTKFDRAAAYMARYVAKNIVAAGLADRCLVQLAYPVGTSDPISVMVRSLIKDISDSSKIKSRMGIEVSDVSIAETIEHLELSFHHVAQSKNLNFLIERAEGLPPTIRTDNNRLQLILKNLLTNAFNFTEEGKVVLRIAPAPKDETYHLDSLNRSHDVVAFSVCDTGIGIPKQAQRSIFEAFQQTDASRKYGGAGLGLFITRELARLLGGEMRVSSTLGKGSTFTFYLPRNYEWLAGNQTQSELRSST